MGLFPFVLLIVAFGIYHLMYFNRITGSVCLIIFAVGGLNATFDTEYMSDVTVAFRSTPLIIVNSAVEAAKTCGRIVKYPFCEDSCLS